MVCKHQDTIVLLEVGETAKQHYLEQSKKTNRPFLLHALELANECDLKYKTSKNQRLLVELTLMKLASIDFASEKKNPESIALANTTVDFIAPASFYANVETSKVTSPLEAKIVEENTSVVPQSKAIALQEIPSEVPSETPVIVELDLEEASSDFTRTIETKPQTNTKKKIQLEIASKRISALSISSLKVKKKHAEERKEDQIDPNSLPKEAFTEADLVLHWNAFVQQIDAEGQKILASNLATDTPKLKEDFAIWIELPNSTMKKEVERDQYELMEHLRAKLNNHFIQLKITVNEEIAKKFAFTPEEKYEKLRQKNPTIDILRKEFDLDL